MKDVSELIIYKQFIELIYYTEMITEKYPKVEKNLWFQLLKQLHMME